MSRFLKKSIALLLSIVMFATLFSGCNTDNSETIVTTVKGYDEFGGAYLDITIDEFNSYGFELGDTFDIDVADMYHFENVGYFDGYYDKQKTVILDAYPGETDLRISACMSSLKNYYPEITIGDKATIKLNTKQGKSELQSALNLTYSNNREDYESDEAFANFREVKVGKIAAGKLYRSASPCDDTYGRAYYADNLAKQHNIKAVLNLADSMVEIHRDYILEKVDTKYYKNLFYTGNVAAHPLDNDYSDAEGFQAELSEMMFRFMFYETPYLVHCTEGKDRTGFICLLIGASMGATYEELRDDYMLTYKNYYNIDEENDKERYDIIVENKFDDMIRKNLTHDETGDISSYNLQECANQYLLDCGFAQKGIDVAMQQLM